MRPTFAALLVVLAAPALLAQEGEDPTARHTRDLAQRFGKFYEPARYEVAPALPATTFPIDPAKVAGWEAVERLGLSEAATRKLLDQGFVATGGFFRGEAAEDVVKAYESLEHREGLSLLVTSDALLHLYHIQFDESLKGIEEREFYLDAVLLVRTLGRRALEIASSHDATEAAAGELALGYLAVADRLLSLDEAALKKDVKRLSDWQVAEYGSAEATEAFLAKLPSLPAPLAVAESDLSRAIEKDLASARAHEGFEQSALFDYREDFSQYKPRGHYDRSEMLTAYFRGLMWLGRMTFLLKGGEPYGPAAPYLVTAETADRQTRAAAILAALLDEKLPDGRLAREVWERLYSVTAYYVGLADDLTPDEYRTALSAISDSEDGKPAIELARELARPGDALLAYRWELARCAPPAIYSGTGESMVTDRAALAGEPSPEVLDKLLGKTMGFRFLGQRFVPDSYWMGRLVFPTVGAATDGPPDRFTGSGGMRVFPRGLDVMALLGSARARAVLAEGADDAYKGYAEEFVRLSKELAALSPADWNRNLYWSWLSCLAALLEPAPEGYPSFMRSEAWLDKSLAAALGSWSELRHDTILYAKQSYTADGGGPPPPPPPGWVEPLPEFLSRLLALSRMTARGLSEMKVLSEAERARLERLDGLLATLLVLSIQELEGEPLREDQVQFLSGLPAALESVAAGAGQGGMKTTLVADVHTDQNTDRCLEEGTGALDLLVVLAPRADGTFFVAAGPAFSYYEFGHPLSARLTDGEWRKLLASDKAPARPAWTRSYRVE